MFCTKILARATVHGGTSVTLSEPILWGIPLLYNSFASGSAETFSSVGDGGIHTVQRVVSVTAVDDDLVFRGRLFTVVGPACTLLVLLSPVEIVVVLEVCLRISLLVCQSVVPSGPQMVVRTEGYFNKRRLKCVKFVD